MATVINDFSSFLSELNQNNKRTVKFSLETVEYEITYSELTSAEEASVQKEFERWFTATYKDENRKDKDVGLQQYRYYKMIAKNMTQLLTFEQFLGMPRTVISAMVGAIEEDLINRYPHIKKHVDALRL